MIGCIKCRRRAARASLVALGLGLLGAGGFSARAQTPEPPPPPPPPGQVGAEPAVPSFLSLADAIGIAMQGSTQLGIRHAQQDASRKARLASYFALGPDLQSLRIIMAKKRLMV